MTTQPRLHLVSGIKHDDEFTNLFATVTRQAERTVDAFTELDADAAWDLAQYVDLVDAGYGVPTSSLYRRCVACLSGFVESRMHRPLSRALFGRSAVLSRLVEDKLEDGAAGLANERRVLQAA